MQWIYTQYLGIYTQYLAYFASILILLTSAATISLIKIIDGKKRWWIISFFTGSLVIALIDVYLIFEIYDWLRSTVLLMSGQCIPSGSDIACDIDIQEHSSYLKIAIVLMITSFILLVIGYLIKALCHDKKQHAA